VRPCRSGSASGGAAEPASRAGCDRCTNSWTTTTAAIAHLAHSTPEPLRFTATDFNSYVTVSTADGAPKRENGFMRASDQPGLGVRPRMDVLGPRVVDVSGKAHDL